MYKSIGYLKPDSRLQTLRGKDVKPVLVTKNEREMCVAIGLFTWLLSVHGQISSVPLFNSSRI